MPCNSPVFVDARMTRQILEQAVRKAVEAPRRAAGAPAAGTLQAKLSAPKDAPGPDSAEAAAQRPASQLSTP